MQVKVGKVTVGGDSSPKILGVMNISPESFYSDSFIPIQEIEDSAEMMIRSGADIIDLGARSTALKAPPLSIETEKERVISALKIINGIDIPISLDTRYPEVLDAALKYDISLINDISGLSNEKYAKLAADSGLPVIAMAAHEKPGDPLDISSTHKAMEKILIRAEKYGIDDIILDPGVGRWVDERSNEADWELCRRFSELKKYQRPLIAAVSRKQFIGRCLNKPPQYLLCGSLAVLYSLLESGADIVRVHDVSETRDIISVFEKMHGK